MNEAVLSTPPGLDIVKSRACELLAECLHVEASTVELDKKLTSYGIDSIDAFTMVGDLEDWLDLELPSTLLWDYESINEIAIFVVGEFENQND